MKRVRSDMYNWILARAAESDIKQLLELVVAEAKKEGTKRKLNAKNIVAESEHYASGAAQGTDSLEAFLLKPPTFTRKQISEIENARKEKAAWRKN